MGGTSQAGRPKVWAVKCRERLNDGTEGWHWRYYLDRIAPTDSELGFHFGGPNWIRSNWSRAYIRDGVTKGDIVLCYQYDDKAIHGLTRMNTDGMQGRKGSGEFDLFYLVPASEAFVIRKPLKITELRSSGCSPECFTAGHQGTIFPISSREFAGTVEAIKALRPGIGKKLDAWLCRPGE